MTTPISIVSSSKQFQFGDRIVTVKELTWRQIISIVDSASAEKGGNLLIASTNAVALTVEGMTKDELLDLTPTQSDALWEAFQEVNKRFLAIAAYFGFDKIIWGAIKGIVQAYRNDLESSLSVLIVLSEQAIQVPSTMDTPTSSTPNENSARPNLSDLSSTALDLSNLDKLSGQPSTPTKVSGPTSSEKIPQDSNQEKQEKQPEAQKS